MARIFVDVDTFTYGDAGSVRFFDIPDSVDLESDKDVSDFVSSQPTPDTIESIVFDIANGYGQIGEDVASDVIAALIANGYLA